MQHKYYTNLQTQYDTITKHSIHNTLSLYMLYYFSQGEGSPVAVGHLGDFALLVHQPALTLAFVEYG